jgi:hypothetical protein
MKFEQAEHIHSDLVALFEQTVLGTNGAKYKHLDVAQSVAHTDNPLSFSLRRRAQLIANITFCKRPFGLYLRYFAFDKRFQSKGKARMNPKSQIKQEIENVFKDITARYPGSQAYCYAYIDAKNVRSKWMSETFGFQTKAYLNTQTFSRVFPKAAANLRKEKIEGQVFQTIESHYSHYSAYFTHFFENGTVYTLCDDKGERLAFAQFHQVRWEIQRLPGKLGGLQVKLLPYIPFLRQLIQPKEHTFLVPDVVCNPSGNIADVSRLFEAVLAQEKLNTMLWWNDTRDLLYQKAQQTFKWGLLHQIIGVAKVDVVVRGDFEPKEPVFIAAFDMV